MNRLIALSLTALMSTSAVAVITTPAPGPGNIQVSCDLWAKLAGSIMDGRQAGVELAAQLEMTQKLSRGEVTQAATVLTVAAFNNPRYDNLQLQEVAKTEFAKSALQACNQRTSF